MAETGPVGPMIAAGVMTPIAGLTPPFASAAGAGVAIRATNSLIAAPVSAPTITPMSAVTPNRPASGATLPPIALTDVPPLVGRAGPAMQVFGAAIAAATYGDEPQDHLARNDPAAATIGAPAGSLASITAPGDAQQAPLDLAHQRWPHAMIDRIEQLRDAADATNTRIRLVPDALGSIDVSLHQDGGMLHVRFVAEQAATQTLIQDAQPRLAAIAEERGLKLGQSAVAGGGIGADTTGSQPQHQQRPAATAMPRSQARAPADHQLATATDGRLA